MTNGCVCHQRKGFLNKKKNENKREEGRGEGGIELSTAHTRVPGVPTELWQIQVLPEPWQPKPAGIEFATPIMQGLNWSPFHLQSGIEEIKLLYLIFNGKKKNIPHSILCFWQIRLLH